MNIFFLLTTNGFFNSVADLQEISLKYTTKWYTALIIKYFPQRTFNKVLYYMDEHELVRNEKQKLREQSICSPYFVIWTAEKDRPRTNYGKLRFQFIPQNKEFV